MELTSFGAGQGELIDHRNYAKVLKCPMLPHILDPLNMMHISRHGLDCQYVCVCDRVLSSWAAIRLIEIKWNGNLNNGDKSISVRVKNFSFNSALFTILIHMHALIVVGRRRSVACGNELFVRLFSFIQSEKPLSLSPIFHLLFARFLSLSHSPIMPFILLFECSLLIIRAFHPSKHCVQISITNE